MLTPAEQLGLAGAAVGVQLGEDLFQPHAAGPEELAVEEHAGHGHDLALAAAESVFAGLQNLILG